MSRASQPAHASPGRRKGPPVTAAAHALVGCGIGIAAAGALALATGLPWLFPSLGPTAMLQTEQPTSEGSSPRNTLIGHTVALGAGYGALLLFHLQTAPSITTTGVSATRIAVAALSLAATACVLLLLRRPHAPAGATTLIVGLGLLRTPTSLAVALVSVCVITAVDLTYNRLTGEPMPLWADLPASGRNRRSTRPPSRKRWTGR